MEYDIAEIRFRNRIEKGEITSMKYKYFYIKDFSEDFFEDYSYLIDPKKLEEVRSKHLSNIR